MQGEGFPERGGERDLPVLAALAVGDADPAGVQVGVGQADRDELGDPDAGVEQGLDEHDVAAAAGGPHRLVVAADLRLGGHVRQFLRGGGHLDAELVAQVPEHLFEVGVVRAFTAQVPGELAGFAPGRGALCRAAVLTHRRGPAQGGSRRSDVPPDPPPQGRRSGRGLRRSSR